MNRQDRKEFAELANLLREPLAELGYNADDMSPKNLKTIQKILAALKTIKQKREEAEMILRNPCITISEIARVAELDRSNISGNEIYRKLIERGTATKREISDNTEIETLRRNLKDEKDNVAEYERREKMNIHFEIEICNLRVELDEVRREKDVLAQSLTNANLKNEQLQAKLYEISQSITLPKENIVS